MAVYTGSDSHWNWGCDFTAGKFAGDCVKYGAGGLYDFNVHNSGKVRLEGEGPPGGSGAAGVCTRVINDQHPPPPPTVPLWAPSAPALCRTCSWRTATCGCPRWTTQTHASASC